MEAQKGWRNKYRVQVDVSGLSRSSALRTFARSLATFAFTDLLNAKERKGIRKGTPAPRSWPHY